VRATALPVPGRGSCIFYGMRYSLFMKVSMSFNSFVQLYGFMCKLANMTSFAYEVRASKVRGWVDFTVFSEHSEVGAVKAIEIYMHKHLT
jgi:hypothetical protein